MKTDQSVILILFETKANAINLNISIKCFSCRLFNSLETIAFPSENIDF